MKLIYLFYVDPYEEYSYGSLLWPLIFMFLNYWALTNIIEKDAD